MTQNSTHLATPPDLSAGQAECEVINNTIGVKVLQNMWTRGLLKLSSDTHTLTIQLSIDGLQLFTSISVLARTVLLCTVMSLKFVCMVVVRNWQMLTSFSVIWYQISKS